MNFKNNNVNSVFVMPKKVEGFLKTASKIELQVILYIFANGDKFRLKEAAAELQISEQEVLSAIAFWRGANVLDDEGKEKVIEVAEPKLKTLLSTSYSNEEISEAIKSKEFSPLYDFAQRKLGRILNTNEIAKLYGLVDIVGIPNDMVMGIIEYCVSKDKFSIHYIEKTAVNIYEEGVHTFKELEKYFENSERLQNAENKIKLILGAQNRAFTKTEHQIIDKWINVWQIDEELISKAYEKTINAISKPSVNYMSSILESWVNFGVKKVGDIDKLQITQKNNGEIKKSLNLNDFIEQPD